MNIVGLFVNPNGRVGRLPYALALGVLYTTFFVFFIATDIQVFLLEHGLGAVRVLPLVFIGWGCVILFIKRMRDSGRSPWIALLLLIPGVSVILLVFAAFLPSKVVEVS
ncbi:DUF805 domain-containing protein [Pseudomonas schmalbachii]|uniref:DUF805 domain-containing protein n=1 Tax=Pseudomonas schmalbachii TaxID=2816993 RepID=A0ABS3TIX8_9PSED|nr:DUF805 domain-containing protein [Pseudomonas schmalbachii]MBO3273609.1 DUF805 domain-containing protein [Pseudomonas schmalbachii]